MGVYVLYSKLDLCFGTGPQWTDDGVYVAYIVNKCGLGHALGLSDIVTDGHYLFGFASISTYAKQSVHNKFVQIQMKTLH